MALVTIVNEDEHISTTYSPSPQKAADDLIRLGRAIRSHTLCAYKPMKFSITAETTKVHIEAILTENEIPKTSIIYMVSVTTLADAYRLQAAFSDAKETLKPLSYPEGTSKKDRRLESARQFAAGKRSLPRRNFKDPRETKILYVGSSRTDFYTRLHQHLGTSTGGLRTYALYLQQWALEGEQPLAITVECWHYDPDQLKKNQVLRHRLVLQTLENFLWKDVKPPFGREGAR
jgi:hypothetical protein